MASNISGGSSYSCHLPGGIRSPSSLWDFLANGKSAQGLVPNDRFNINGFYHANIERAGVVNADGGYFLQDDIREFENDFFGINKLEAASMDPQQRKLLEVVFECFENSGVSMTKISGTNTGVYVGNFTVDQILRNARDADYSNRYSATGAGIAIGANRISHVFDLHGPSVTLDTGCSSSMYCLHNAVCALKAGDCDGAIVASANLITSPEQHIWTVRGGVISKTSTCHTFDISADGYGRADAVNAVYLKKLSSAMRDGDNIQAVIRGTAINSNGKTPGISHPSAEFQEAVIRKAYATAGLSLAETDYVECHGTATATGDPVEVSAIKKCFTPRNDIPLIIGSVKAGLGHSEAASGLTSLIKVVLSFQNGKIPPTHGVKELNPKFQLGSSNIIVATELMDWPRNRQRASISSYGYGGANSHCILESVDSYKNRLSSQNCVDLGHADIKSHDQLFVFPFSTFSSKSLVSRIGQISRVIQTCHPKALEGLAFTLARRDSHMRRKSFLMARGGLNGVISLIEDNQTQAPELTNIMGPYPMAFIFTGQGAQYAGMAKELLKRPGPFLDTVKDLDCALQDLPANLAPSWTLRSVLCESVDTSSVNDASLSQPLCTAIQIGLVNTLRHCGIHPTVVVGHSSGEIAAACTAGIVTEKQAILASYFRGKSIEKLQSRGAMIAVGLSVESARRLIENEGLVDAISIACVNSPESVTLSGTLEAVNYLFQTTQQRQIFSRKLETGGRAYHSPMMQEIGAIYEDFLKMYCSENLCVASQARMYSSVEVPGEDLAVLSSDTNMPRYWRDNLEKPVQFSAVITKITQNQEYHFLEIGPHSALKGPIKQTLKTLNLGHLPYHPTLVRKQNADISMNKLMGQLYIHGHTINWNRVNNINRRNMLLFPDLPPYPWDYTGGLLWSESRPSVELRQREFLRHELLGVRQLAGNGIDWTWRNVLHLDEIPWLRDHKIEAQIVFPAVGYLGMIMVAMDQINSTVKSQRDTHTETLVPEAFEFRNVKINKALVLDEETGRENEVELHTTVSRQKISTSSSSAIWFEFQVSSWDSGQATVHCIGSVRIIESLNSTGTSVVTDSCNYETWPDMQPWYEKFAKEGLRAGPQFQTLSKLQTDRSRVKRDSIAVTTIKPWLIDHERPCYPVHPLVIDACVQAAIFGGTAGNLDALRGVMLVFITECRIGTVALNSSAGEGIIYATVTKTGPTTQCAECTLRDSNNSTLVHLKDARMSIYTGMAEPALDDTRGNLERYPCLRTHWKPDISRLRAGQETEIRDYIKECYKPNEMEISNDVMFLEVSTLIDLAGHKNPDIRVLELDGWNNLSRKHLLNSLDNDTAFPRYKCWHLGNLNLDGQVTVDDGHQGPYDVLLVPGNPLYDHQSYYTDYFLHLLSENAVIISERTDTKHQEKLNSNLFTTIEVGEKILLTSRAKEEFPLNGKNVVLVVRQPSFKLSTLATRLIRYIQNVNREGKTSCVELTNLQYLSLSPETPFLAQMNQIEMDLLRRATDTVTNVLWITGGSLLSKPDPDLLLANGFSRALRIEQPSLLLSVIDIGRVESHESYTKNTCECLLEVLLCQQFNSKDDKEFVLHNGLLHISRFQPDWGLNSRFRKRFEAGQHASRQLSPIASIGLAHLSIDKAGIRDSMYFQQVSVPATVPPAGFVDVTVKAVSLNAKDVYAISGRIETRANTISLEFSGVVKAVGSDVTHVQKGDRVIAVVPNRFNTTERVPAWLTFKMLPHEEFVVMASLPTVYASALYALNDRAKIRQGESVLIHAGSGAFGFAAITIAQRAGAIVYSTSLNIPSSHIFNSRTEQFVAGVMTATGGRGVDVVINSLTGDLMHAGWRCMANFGRFVEVGKKELVDVGRLDMDVFLRNATFTAFDLTELAYSADEFHRNTLTRNIQETLNLYRAGQIKPAPITIFDVENISEAYKFFSSKDRVGKIVISLETPQSLVEVMPSKYLCCFEDEKVYLLVGCLGGLGRSLSRWMIQRGARNVVFLGRTGCEKPEAQALVSHMRSTGTNVTVVRGDVCCFDNVIQAIDTCNKTGKAIGGVIQAAMRVKADLFHRMSSEAWHSVIQPKLTGSWNLHKALEGNDAALDFFLMTSSVSGSMGSAAESNYCAANAFLDGFARWRRTQNKPAVSIGLGMIEEVGFLHDNPEIEAMQLRKGIQPLNESEFLQIIDLALAESMNERNHKNLMKSHILTGMEPLGIRDGFRGDSLGEFVATDPRMAIISAAVTANRATAGAKPYGKNLEQLVAEIPWLRDINLKAVGSLVLERDAPSLEIGTLRLLRKRFAIMLLTVLDELDNHRPLVDFGVDSMLGAEFRTWLWNTFRVDIPFLDILSSGQTLAILARRVAQKLTARG
ncbi:polyketide synthase-like protein [Ustulina deusta]|nr:polyketide synthase-like protein [Ustulina deusta]